MIYINNSMRLKLIEQLGFSAVFARLNNDKSVIDYIYATDVRFFKENKCAWGFCKYGLTQDEALRELKG